MVTTMNKKIRYLVFAGAFLGMGFSMPSCPGQQAMQQQLDTLQQGQADATRKMQGLETQLKTANSDMATLKQNVEMMAGQMKTQMDQMTTSMKEMETKLAAMHTAKPASKARPVRTSGKRRR